MQKKQRNWLTNALAVGIVVGSLVAVGGVWWSLSWLEARAYNRATGANVSTVDAMFIQLRVYGNPEGGK